MTLCKENRQLTDDNDIWCLLCCYPEQPVVNLAGHDCKVTLRTVMAFFSRLRRTLKNVHNKVHTEKYIWSVFCFRFVFIKLDTNRFKQHSVLRNKSSNCIYIRNLRPQITLIITKTNQNNTIVFNIPPITYGKIVSQWRIFASLKRVSFSLLLVACSAPTYYLQYRHHLNLTLYMYRGRFLVWGKRKFTCFQMTVIHNGNDISSIAIYKRNIFIHLNVIGSLKFSNSHIIINVWFKQPIPWCCV